MSPLAAWLSENPLQDATLEQVENSTVQGHVPARVCRFKSCSRHHEGPGLQVRGFCFQPLRHFGVSVILTVRVSLPRRTLRVMVSPTWRLRT
jgi:hypothetical protein